ncbi:MAG: ATP synthase subunit I [Lachnospirales bacterium]
MFKLSITSKKMMQILLGIGLIIFGLSYAFIGKTFALGIAFGVFTSVVRIFLLNHTTDRMLDMEVRKAKVYMATNYFFRMFFVIFAFIIAAKSSDIDIIGVFLGVIIMQPSAYLTGFLLKDKDLPYDKDKIVKFDDDF